MSRIGRLNTKCVVGFESGAALQVKFAAHPDSLLPEEEGEFILFRQPGAAFPAERDRLAWFFSFRRSKRRLVSFIKEQLPFPPPRALRMSADTGIIVLRTNLSYTIFGLNCSYELPRAPTRRSFGRLSTRRIASSPPGR